MYMFVCLDGGLVGNNFPTKGRPGSDKINLAPSGRKWRREKRFFSDSTTINL